MQPKKGDTLIITALQNKTVPWQLFEECIYDSDFSSEAYRVKWNGGNWILNKDCCRIKIDNEFELREGEYAVVVKQQEIDPHNYPINTIVYLHEKKVVDGVNKYDCRAFNEDLPIRQMIFDYALRPVKRADIVKHVKTGEDFVFIQKGEETPLMNVRSTLGSELIMPINEFVYNEFVMDATDGWGEGW